MKKIGKIILFILLGIIIFGSLLFLAVLIYNFKIKEPETETQLQSTKAVTKEKEILKDETSQLSLVMVGDCLIHEAVYNSAKLSDGSYDFTPMFTLVKPIIQEYDLAFYNQESILGGVQLGLSAYPRFNSPYSVGDAMVDAGFNLVSLANNHTLDRGTDAINNSLNYWKNKNVLTSGSYSSFEDRDNILVKNKNGITYALLAYTTVTNGLTRPKNQEYYLNVYDEEQVKKDISYIRDKVDLLMVSMHFGNEYSLTQSKEQEQIASYLASLNVDIVIGHHPHVIQPVTYIGNTLVMYSLGNFISGQLTTDQLSGVMIGVDVIKNSNTDSISFKNLRADLIYTQTRNLVTKKYEYRLIPYNDLTEKILPNKDQHKEKYANILNSLGANINIR